MFLFFQLVILLLSVVIHEVSHGAAANALGDPTAKSLGRLTLNPLKHLDPLGSVIFPLILFLTKSSFIFGWAKPVPYNPYNLKWPRWGPAAVAFAGPLSNLAIVLVFGIYLILQGGTITLFNSLIATVVFINLWLAIINLVPVPPLDGSKILFAILPVRFQQLHFWLEKWGLFIALLILFLGVGLLASLADYLFGLFIGKSYIEFFIFLRASF
ncbi:site-2 protease family protein [Candidatus Parcubacteria bacterium]|nr:MAG: site-2 protease family protein [Candidatus Parcubacteria bacterium]